MKLHIYTDNQMQHKTVVALLEYLGVTTFDNSPMNEYSTRAWKRSRRVFNRIEVDLVTMELSGYATTTSSYHGDLLWPRDCVKLMELVKPAVNKLEDSFKREESMNITTSPYSLTVSGDNVKIGEYNLRRGDIASIFHKMKALQCDS